jgi:hypothetical protein
MTEGQYQATEAVEAMVREHHAPTAPLSEFIPAYRDDDNWWWQLSCGHHQNLFEEATDRIDELARELAARDAVIEQIRALAEALMAEGKADFQRDESWFGQGRAEGLGHSSRRITAVLSALPSTGETNDGQ